MIKSILLALLISSQAFAGLPPTTSKVSSDASDITTFKYQFPNFTGTHTGTTLSIGINSVAGGGTGASTAGTARTNLGLGSIATQDASNVAITGGAIDGTIIGGTTKAAGSFSSLTDTGTLVDSANGALSTPAASFTGTPVTGGSGTTTFPLMYLNSGTAPTSWSTSGTLLGLNSPSGFAGNLIDLHTNGGNSIFSVASNAALTVSGSITAPTLIASGISNFYNPGTTNIASTSSSLYQFAGSSNIGIRNGLAAGSTSSTLGVGFNYGGTVIGSGVLTTPATGTNAWLANEVVNPIGAVTSGGAAITNTASLYVGAPSSAGTNNYSVYSAGNIASATNIIPGSASTATASGTTVLTNASAQIQTFTGTLTQTVTLPVVTTLQNGLSYQFFNYSTNAVLVQSSGLNTLQNMAANTTLTVTVINTAGGTGTASWSWVYQNIQSTLPNLNPMTTGGDIIYGGAAGAATRLANGTTGQYLQSTGSTNAPVWSSYVAPYPQTFTAGNGTYNPTYAFIVSSANATVGATYTNNSVTYTVGQTIASGTLLYAQGSGAPLASGTLTKASGTGDATITFTTYRAPVYSEIDLWGSGGGGGGSGSSGGSGGGSGNPSCISTTGTTTCTGTVYATCPGGGGGGGPGAGGGGSGGACTITTSSTLFSRNNIAGGNGFTAANINSSLTFQEGGAGASGPFGGGSALNSAPAANSGGGGAGGSGSGTGVSLGAGGAAGSYAKIIFVNPIPMHYIAGTKGTAGSAGTSGTGGSTGADGLDLFLDYYQ